MKFESICLFGYSPLFKEIEIICQKLNIDLTIICGNRQLESIENLGLEIKRNKINVFKKLQTNKLEKLFNKNDSLLGLSFGSPFIFNQSDINFFSGNLLNSHGSPLPEFKGGGGYSWRILQGDKRGSSLIHFVTPEIDEGEIVFCHDFTFSNNEVLPYHYQDRQFKEDKANIIPWIDAILNEPSKLKKIKTNNINDQESYFPRLNTDIHGYINWKLNINYLQKNIRAFSKPYPGAKTFIRGQEVRIFNCEILKEKIFHPFLAGLVLHQKNDHYHVAAEGGLLIVKKDDISLKNENLEINLGDRFYTPINYLEKALTTRVFFTPEGQKIVDYDK